MGRVALLLGGLLAGPAGAQEPQPAPPSSAQQLKDAIAAIKRRVEAQRQSAASSPAGAVAEELRTAREGVDNLARTMGELRAERDGLREQLMAARDEAGQLRAQLASLQAETTKTAQATTASMAALQRDLDAMRQERGTLAEARTAAEAKLAEREARLATLEVEAGQLRSAQEAAQRTLGDEAGQLRARVAGLEGDLARLRSESEAREQGLGRSLTAELDATRAKLAAAEREGNELRVVATASVEEVRSLSEQLMAAFSEKQTLVAASAELSGAKALQDLQLAAREAEPAAGIPAAAPPEVAAPAALPVAVAAPEPEAPSVPAAWTRIVLDGGSFTQERLSPQASSTLARVADEISAGRGAVRVVGHTDSEGDAEANRRLSLRRAQSVRDFLVSTYGYEANRFQVEGKGEDEPTASNDTPTGRRTNRRVEVFVAR